MAARLGLLTAAGWWAGFTVITAKGLRELKKPESLPARYRNRSRLAAYISIGVGRTVATARHVRQFRHLVLFLLAFMLYNDGIQTVIDMATIYGTEELKLSATTLMLTLLVIQIIAVVGAITFSRIAEWIGTKRAIMLTLVLWAGVVIYAYFIQTAEEYFALGAVVGIVLGGSQALSRSFYSSMVPVEAAAEFFGFYTVFSKFSAIWGPLVFAIIRQWAGSARLAIISLVIFFVLGLILIAFVDEKKARLARESGLFARDNV
jgi:MFS transporter, UMF1 family